MSNSKIGTVLHFDGSGYNRCKHTYEDRIIPAWNDIVVAYNGLGLGVFNQKVYKLITDKGMKEVKEQYDQYLAREMKKLKAPLLIKKLQSSDSDQIPFRKLEQAWKSLLETIARESSSPIHILSKVIFDHDFLTYDLGLEEFAIDEIKMETAYKKILSTDQQQAAYNALLDFKEAYKKLKGVLSESLNVPIAKVSILPNCGDYGEQIIYEDSGEFKIDKKYLSDII